VLIDLKVRPEVPPLAGFTHVRMTKFFNVKVMNQGKTIFSRALILASKALNFFSRSE
jgi:hypothetical protein